MAKVRYKTVVDGGSFTDSIGVFDTKKMAEAAGEDWLANMQLHFLDTLSPEQRNEINARTHDEELWRVLEEYGCDFGYTIEEEEEEY